MDIIFWGFHDHQFSAKKLHRALWKGQGSEFVALLMYSLTHRIGTVGRKITTTWEIHAANTILGTLNPNYYNTPRVLMNQRIFWSAKLPSLKFRRSFFLLKLTVIPTHWLHMSNKKKNVKASRRRKNLKLWKKLSRLYCAIINGILKLLIKFWVTVIYLLHWMDFIDMTGANISGKLYVWVVNCKIQDQLNFWLEHIKQ